MQPPLVSILVPTDTRPAMLKRCLAHTLEVIKVSPHLFEVIVGDNSNLPENHEIFLSFKSVWNGRAKYIAHPTSLGMQGNFNALITEASAHWIQFVHDDDFLLPGSEQALLAAVEEGSASPYKFRVCLVDIKGQKIRNEGQTGTSILSPEHSLKKALSDSSFFRFPSIFATKKMYEECGCFDQHYGYISDQALWLEMCSRHGLIEKPDVTVAYCIHEGAGTSSMFTSEYIARLETLLSKYASFVSEDSLAQRKLVSRFLWKFTLAGCIRALRQRNWILLRKRATIFDHLSSMGYDCPLQWIPLRIIFGVI